MHLNLMTAHNLITILMKSNDQILFLVSLNDIYLNTVYIIFKTAKTVAKDLLLIKIKYNDKNCSEKVLNHPSADLIVS